MATSAIVRSLVAKQAPEGFVHAAKAFRESHPTWLWALGISGATLATTVGTAFGLIQMSLSSVKSDVNFLQQAIPDLRKELRQEIADLRIKLIDVNKRSTNLILEEIKRQR